MCYLQLHCGENSLFSLGLKTVHMLYILDIEFPALSVLLNLSFLWAVAFTRH